MNLTIEGDRYKGVFAPLPLGFSSEASGAPRTRSLWPTKFNDHQQSKYWWDGAGTVTEKTVGQPHFFLFKTAEYTTRGYMGWNPNWIHGRQGDYTLEEAIVNYGQKEEALWGGPRGLVLAEGRRLELKDLVLGRIFEEVELSEEEIPFVQIPKLDTLRLYESGLLIKAQI